MSLCGNFVSRVPCPCIKSFGSNSCKKIAGRRWWLESTLLRWDCSVALEKGVLRSFPFILSSYWGVFKKISGWTFQWKGHFAKVNPSENVSGSSNKHHNDASTPAAGWICNTWFWQVLIAQTCCLKLWAKLCSRTMYKTFLLIKLCALI